MDGKQIKDGNGQDEINLIDIMRTLWQQKIIILVTTFIGLLIGLSYISFTKPVYEVTAYIYPPTLKDFSALNHGRSNEKSSLLTTSSVKDVYGFFSQSLLSESTKWDFYEKSFLPVMSSKYSANKIPQLFGKSVIVKEISTRSILTQETKPSNYTITVRGNSPQEVATWVKDYIDLAQQRAVKALLAEDKEERAGVIRELQNKVDSIREVANNNRLDRIQQLKEAIKVAQALGMKSSSFNGAMIDASALNNPSLMYLRGQNALQAELNNLNVRDSNDAFVPSKYKLREQQERLDYYKKIVINPEQINLFKLDGSIEPPAYPVAMRKSLILGISLFAGLFLGFLIVIMRRFVSVLHS